MSKLSFVTRRISDAAGIRTQCAVLPVFKDARLAGAARQLDKASGGNISKIIDLGEFTGKRGQSQVLPGPGGVQRVLLVGAGERDKFDRAGQLELSQNIASAVTGLRAADATLLLGDLPSKSADQRWLLGTLARDLTTACYRYTETVSKPKEASKLAKLVVDPGKVLTPNESRHLLTDGHQIGAGVNTARNLANLPGNICTPDYLAKEARKLARKYKKLTAKILDEKKMAELGMGSLLSVSAGSDQPARLIIMEYRGAKTQDKPHVLVGKGITFDSGGISLKPGAKMDEMKFDMGGAASVFGTIQAVCDLELPLNVVCIVAAAENMPSGRATKPGDVVTSMSGKTIEILNTDAEGRLVLCDALTYAERYKPASVVDIATLTGACVVALGSHASALYANNEDLAEQLLAAGIESHDRAWRMPLWEDYQKQLNTNFADVANIGGPGGGSITAACFLSRFAEKYPWAHLDIAGSAWDSTPKGATGRPVPLLTRYLQDRAAS
jgi:leucyl aminopeptidase